MEHAADCQLEVKEKIENHENCSDRESSIESFHTNKSELSVATETELIDVDEIELSDEESWLYKSPKKLTSDEKSVSTQKWLQKNVEDMDDVELQATRSALLTKLNELKLLNSSIEEKEAQKDIKASNVPCVDEIVVNTTDYNCLTESSRPSSNSEESTIMNSRNENDECQHKTGWKSNKVFDVDDVQKIARLQEESLKQSTYKFLSQTGKKSSNSRDLSPVSPAQVIGLNKPASVEALNSCVDKLSHTTVYSMVPLQGMKKQHMFSSSSALNCSQEYHRGSLPNINKGYYSLKSKKSKRPSEPKVSCPLPIYPTHSKASINGIVSQICKSERPKGI